MMAIVGIMLLLPFGAFAQEEDAAPVEAPMEAPVGTPVEASAEAPVEVPLEVPPGGFIHTVVQGDTLWDLSAKYLESPWRWNEIWELNRFLTNPHYIYPGIKIVIVPSGPREADLYLGSSAAQEVVLLSDPDPGFVAPPKDERLTYFDISAAQVIRAGQFLKEKPVGIGKIDGGKEPKEGFSTGDTLFLSLDQDVNEGQLLAVYRVRGPIKVPGGKVTSGYVKYLIGILQVAQVKDGRLTAMTRESFEDITRSDLVSDEIPAFYRIGVVHADDDMRSTVIAGQLTNAELASGDFIFIDSGSASGVEVGNMFRVFRAVDFEAGASKVASSGIMIEVSRAVAVRVNEDFSTLYVHKSEKSFDVGSQTRRGLIAK